VLDHPTISRFRNLLARRGLAEALFAEVTRQIEAKGLVVKAGTLVDATLIPAAAAQPPRQRGVGRSAADRAQPGSSTRAAARCSGTASCGG
jgi:IS5 family transposase